MKFVNNWYMLDGDTWFSRATEPARPRNWMVMVNRSFGVCKKYITNFKYAIDCGAHYGSWAVVMAREFDQMVALEARDDIFSCLIKNTEHLTNIELKHAAVGDRHESVDIGITKRWKGSDNSGVACVVGEGNTSKVVKIINSVPMITIDSLNLNDVGFIKIDVEGCEKLVLQGAEQTLLAHKPVIIFEEMGAQCSQYGIPPGATGKYLESLGAKFRESADKHNHIYSWD